MCIHVYKYLKHTTDCNTPVCTYTHGQWIQSYSILSDNSYSKILEALGYTYSRCEPVHDNINPVQPAIYVRIHRVGLGNIENSALQLLQQKESQLLPIYCNVSTIINRAQ